MRRRRKTQPSVWQSLNEPVLEVTPGFAKNLLFVAILLLGVVWLGPYFGSQRSEVRSQISDLRIPTSEFRFQVAGIQTIAPTWYYTLRDLPYDLTLAFGQAANEVLDVSDAVAPVAEFYAPGFEAISDAWLELMADPY